MAEDSFVVRGGVFTKSIGTVTALPPVASVQGTVFWVSDLSTNPLTTAGLTATGGGTTQGRVISDGTRYKIYGPNAS
jgi:hypothetical protein